MRAFRPIDRRPSRCILVCGALLILVHAAAWSQTPPQWLLGDWVLNSEKTQALTPKQKGGGGGNIGTPTIAIGGVGIPLPGGGSAPVGGGGAQDPRVLRCDAMSVSMSGEQIRFEYRGSGEETMVPGNDQGRKTTWTRSRLTQNYTTTVRSVTKNYELQDDGTLIVKVKINPKGAKGATHVRVFERPAEPGTGPGSDSSTD